MARFTFCSLASLTILCVAGTAPVMAQQACPPPCPPGAPADYPYPTPSSEYYLPSPTPGAMNPQTSPGELPDAPPAPAQPGSPTQAPPMSPQQPSMQDSLPQDFSGMNDFNAAPPQMAPPTFNPGGGMPTTAATSSQVTAPNMIGDLFGTAFSGYVPVVIDNFFAYGNTGIADGPFNTASNSPFVSDDPLSTLYIGRNTNPGDALATISPVNISPVTVGSQAAIYAADPTLSSPVRVQNNATAQLEVEQYAATIHGTGSAQFVADASSLELNPGGPVVPPIVPVAPEVAYNYNYLVLSEVAGISDPGGLPGAVVGRQKLAENTSPLPHDRVFVNYSYFNNTPLLPGGVNVNRITPGFEKTFFGGNMSVEVRAPFATTLDSDIVAGGITDTSSAEFGNVTVYLKALLWDAGYEAISAGLGFSLPTADDVLVRTAAGVPLLEVQNESVHILPFIGGLYMPTEKIFFQSLLQLDIDPSGNPMRFSEFNNGVPNGTLQPVGRPHDSDYVFFTLNAGWWVYEAPVVGACGCEECSRGRGCGFIRGIAPMIELHYNATFDDGDAIFASRGPATVQIGDTSRSNFELWNMVFGLNIDCRHNANLMLGYATPLNSDDQKQFDSEFRVVFNWFFGGPDRVRSCGDGFCRF